MKPQVSLMIFFVAFILYLFYHKSLTKPKQYCLWNTQELFLILLFLSSSPLFNESLSMTDLTSKLKQQLPVSPSLSTWHLFRLLLCLTQFSSVQFIHSVMSDSMTHGLLHSQASLSFTSSQSLLKLMSIQSVTPSNHLIRLFPLVLLPSIFPSIRVFSNELALHIRWPKYWHFSRGPWMNIQCWFSLRSP